MAGDSNPDIGSLGNSISSFIFGGNTGLSYSALRRRQAIAEAVAKQAAAQPYAQNVGQGIQALGRALGSRMQESRLATAEAEYAKRNAANVQRYLGGGGVTTAQPNQSVAKPMQAQPTAPAAPTPAASGQPNVFMGQPYKPASVVPTPDVNPNAPPPAPAPGAAPQDYDTQDIPPMARPIRDRIAAAVQGQRQPQEQQTATAPGVSEVPQPNPTLPGATPPVQAQSFLLSQPGEDATPSTPQTFSGGGEVDPAILARRAAIGGIESNVRGDPYQAVGSVTANGDRAYGKYQIMGRNIPQWSQAALGRAVSVPEFMSSKAIQDAIFDHRFGGYVRNYGEEGAARAWYAGEKGMKNLNATDIHGRLNVQQYGQDYLRRLGQRDTSEGAVPRGAAVDAGVSVFDDENPPTPSDIAPAPTPMQLAQAGNRLTSDMFSAAPTMPGGMQRAAPTAPQTAAPKSAAPSIPGATSKVYVAPMPDEVPPPQVVPMSQRERGARALLASNPEDPQNKVLAEQVIEEEKEKRRYEQDRNNTAYAAAVQHRQQMLTAHQTSVGTEQERQAALDKNLAEAAARKAYGNLPEEIKTRLTDSKKDADASVGALEAVNNAELAMKSGALFGAGASAKLLAYKAAAAAGNQNAARIVAATETFQSNLGGQVAQAIRQYAGKDVSTKELEFARSMVGGQVGLNEQTAQRLLDITRRASQEKIRDHQSLVGEALIGQPDLLRNVYKERGLGQSTPLRGSVPNFNSAAEAEAANLPDNTKITINGKPATWRR